MAIYLPEKKALFLHIPKTGGHWVHHVLKKLNIPHQRSQDNVGHLHSKKHHCPEEVKFTFCFVRHPVKWYESWWKYMAGRWGGIQGKDHPLTPIHDCRSDDFNIFVQQVLAAEPGFVSQMYESYMPVDFVGKQENLSSNLQCVLKQLGYKYNIEDLEAVPQTHVSNCKFDEPVWNEELRRQVEAAEYVAINKWYKGMI